MIINMRVGEFSIIFKSVASSFKTILPLHAPYTFHYHLTSYNLQTLLRSASQITFLVRLYMYMSEGTGIQS